MDTIKDPLFDKLYHIDQFMNVLALVLSESLLIFSFKLSMAVITSSYLISDPRCVDMMLNKMRHSKAAWYAVNFVSIGGVSITSEASEPQPKRWHLRHLTNCDLDPDAGASLSKYSTRTRHFPIPAHPYQTAKPVPSMPDV